MGKILRISLKLILTQNTLGCFGLIIGGAFERNLMWKNIFSKIKDAHITAR